MLCIVVRWVACLLPTKYTVSHSSRHQSASRIAGILCLAVLVMLWSRVLCALLSLFVRFFGSLPHGALTMTASFDPGHESIENG